MILNQTDEQLKTLALDIFAGRVFTDRHIRQPNLFQSVFMVFAFMEQEQLEKLKENPPGLIYEYLSEAGEICINDHPMFLSVKMLNQEDAKKVFKLIEQIKASINALQVSHNEPTHPV